MAGLRHITEAVQAAAFAYHGGVPELAKKLDKRPSTLYDELNPYEGKTGNGKIGLEDYVTLAKETGDRKAVQMICAELGGRFVPVDLPEDDSPRGGLVWAATTACLAFLDAVKSGDIHHTRLSILHSEAVSRLDAVQAGVRKMAEGMAVALSLSDPESTQFDAPAPKLSWPKRLYVWRKR
jgi:hypothetical protein